MKTLINYIKENLETDEFSYKYDVWFQKDKKHEKAFLDLLSRLAELKVVTKEDVESFLENNSGFNLKNFVDFFDDTIKTQDDINKDYIYLFTKIIETFITNFNLKNKIEYNLQALKNGEPNVEIDVQQVDKMNGGM